MKRHLRNLVAAALMATVVAMALAINDSGGSGGGSYTDRTKEEMRDLLREYRELRHVQQQSAHAENEPEPISARPLTDRHAFTDAVAMQLTLTVNGREQEVLDFTNASSIAVFEFTIQPGARFPWHTHPGTPLIAIIKGDFVFVYADDCVERHYPAGTALVDPGFDNVHTAFNPSQEHETVVIVTFLGAPSEGPITLPVDAAQEAELNERCGLEPATHAH